MSTSTNGFLQAIKQLFSAPQNTQSVSSGRSVSNQLPNNSIAILSGKGGVGKTTTLLGLAGAAANQGLKVLLIDLDPQGSLTLAAVDRSTTHTALDAYYSKSLSEIAEPVSWNEWRGKIFIVPSNRALSRVETHVEPAVSTFRLSQSLGDLSAYDLVLIDAPAALNSLTFDAIGLAKNVVVVAEPSLYSLKAASEAVEFALSAPQLPNMNLRSVKVLLNKVDGSAESTFRAKELRSMYPKLVAKSQLTFSDAVVESNSEGIPVQVIRGVEATLAANEFDALLKELLGN